MSKQYPWPHVTGNRILILILVSEILDHCQNLLDDPRKTTWGARSNDAAYSRHCEEELSNQNTK